MNTTNTQLDLNKVKEIIFQDIFKLLDSFNLEYMQDGDNIFMKCPIHEGSDNPNALSIAIDKQVWRCWTRGCHDHYSCNIWGLIKGLLHTDSFSDALKYVCKLYNVNGASKNVSNKYSNAGNIDSDFGDIVRQISYSKKRFANIEREIDTTRPNTEGCVSPYFVSRGFSPDTLEYFGVRSTTQSTKGILRHRAIIPITDSNGVYVGYIGRATRDFVKPKYVFSKGIRKSDYLYNYHNAVGSMAHLDALFLVEGQGDVWKLWECGVKNTVGLFGKDVSAEQRKLLLSSGATKLVVLTDNDQAGREAKIKIRRDLGRLFKLVFPKMYTKDLGNMPHETIQENILKDLRGYY